METLQINELINFVLSSVLFAFLLVLTRKKKILAKFWIWSAFFYLVSNFATIAESFILPNAFNFIEHLSFSVASLIVTIGLFITIKQQ